MAGIAQQYVSKQTREKKTKKQKAKYNNNLTSFTLFFNIIFQKYSIFIYFKFSKKQYIFIYFKFYFFIKQTPQLFSKKFYLSINEVFCSSKEKIESISASLSAPPITSFSHENYEVVSSKPSLFQSPTLSSLISSELKYIYIVYLYTIYM